MASGKTVKVKMWCNAGHAEEVVEVEVFDPMLAGGGQSEEIQIEQAFHKWLDNHEDCGFEVVETVEGSDRRS